MAPFGRVAIMHRGGLAMRGTEFCVVQTIIGLLDRGWDVTLIANHPHVILDGLPGANVGSFQASFPEFMIDGKQRTFPAARYLREHGRLREFLRRISPTAILSSGGLPCQIGLPLARRLGIPLVAHVHHPAPRRYFYIWLVRWADAIISPSRFTAANVRRATGREPVVVPNGIDLGRFHQAQRDPAWRQSVGIDPSALVVAQVGALSPHKGIEVTLSALAEVNRRGYRAHGLIIGDGPLRNELQEQARALGIEHSATFTGRVPDVAPWLQHVADVHVMPSRAEGFGLVAVEAAACGLPNVVANNTALAEVVRHEVDGMHVKPNDSLGLADALERMCREPAWRSAMGAAGAAQAVAQYSAVTFRNSMVDVLEAVVHRHRAQTAA